MHRNGLASGSLKINVVSFEEPKIGAQDRSPRSGQCYSGSLLCIGESNNVLVILKIRSFPSQPQRSHSQDHSTPGVPNILRFRVGPVQVGSETASRNIVFQHPEYNVSILLTSFGLNLVRWLQRSASFFKCCDFSP